MFFLISGFLYGRKEDLKIKTFLTTRLKKIYLPYIIYVAIAVVAIYVVTGRPITWAQAAIYTFNIQGFMGNSIEGLNHLWFLSVLMVCYLLTPVVKFSLKRNHWATIAVLICIALIEYLWLQKKYALFTWIALYIGGLIVGSVDAKYAKWIGLSSIPTTVLLTLFLPNVSALTKSCYSTLSVWIHVFLAISILMVLYLSTRTIINPPNKPRWLSWLDDHSYEIYLTHHLYILGACSLLFISNCLLIGIVCVVASTIISAIILKQLSKIIAK